MPDGFHPDSTRIPPGFRDLIKQVSKQVASQVTTTTNGEVSSYTYGLYCARSDGVTAQIGGQP